MTSTIRFSFVFALILVMAAPAMAQRKKKKPKPQEDPVELTEEQKNLETAKTLMQEGLALQQEGDNEGALAKFQGAWDALPDPDLQVLIGDTLRRLGNNEAAVAAWKKYVELMPEGPYVEQMNDRINTVEKELAEAEKKQKEEEERLRLEEEKRKKEEERLRLEEENKLDMALNAMILGGADQRASVVFRLFGGGLIRFGKFAPEAHIALEGLLRAGGDSQGTSAQSITVIDVGARYAFTDEHFAGPFVAVGGGFGFFLGDGNEVTLQDDMDTCGNFEGFDCTFEVDKQITGRAGLGYGFKSGDKTTVAIRLDVNTWWYRVADTQPLGSPTPAQVLKPQTALAVMLGLEFLRWR